MVKMQQNQSNRFRGPSCTQGKDQGALCECSFPDRLDPKEGGEPWALKVGDPWENPIVYPNNVYMYIYIYMYRVKAGGSPEGNYFENVDFILVFKVIYGFESICMTIENVTCCADKLQVYPRRNILMLQLSRRQNMFVSFVR